MSGERQNGDRNIRSVMKLSNSGVGLKKEIDDGAGENPFTFADRLLMSKHGKKASIILTAAAVFGGSAAAAESAIVINGEMPSQGEIDLTGQKEMETFKQIYSEFSNGEGELSDEKLKGKLFGDPIKEPDLGFREVGLNTHVNFQAILLFHKNIDGEEILVLGLKNRKGERVVTAVTWPVDKLIGLGYGVFVTKTNATNSWLKGETYYDQNEIGLVLDGKIGSVLRISMNSKPEDIKLNGPNEEYNNLYYSLFSNKTDINRSFLAAIWRSESKNMSKDTKEFFQSLKNKGNLLTIENYSDFLKLANTSSNLPFISNFYYQ